MVLFGLGFLFRGEEDGVDPVLKERLFHAGVVLGTEDGEAFDGAALGAVVEEADDLVVGGFLEAEDGGHALVGGAVDHHALVLVFLLDAVVEVFPDEDHQYAHGDEEAEGQEGVNAEDQHQGGVEAPGDQGGEGQQDGFQDGGGEKEAQVAHGEVADDDPVGPEDQEGHEGVEGGADEVGRMESPGGGEGEEGRAEEEVDRNDDQSGGQDGQDDVHEEDEGLAEVGIAEALED